MGTVSVKDSNNVFSDHSGIKLEITNKGLWKTPKFWGTKLHNSVSLRKKETGEYLELNVN